MGKRTEKQDEGKIVDNIGINNTSNPEVLFHIIVNRREEKSGTGKIQERYNAFYCI